MTKIKLIVKSLLPVAVALLTLGSCAKTSDVDTLKTQVTTLENDLNAAIQNTASELAKLNQAVAAAATQTEVNAIKENIKAVEEKLKALDELKAQIEELKGKTGDNASAIAAIQQKLDKIVGKVSISVSAPGFEKKELVNVKFAKWNSDESDAFKTISKAFPEVLVYEKGETVYKEGYANVIVNPGEVDFTQYVYGFVDVEGNDVELLYGEAERGFNTKGTSGFWKIGVNVCVGSEKKFVEEQGPFSLQVSPRDEEVTANTEFKYFVKATDFSDVDVKISAQNENDSAVVFYAPSINVFEPVSEIFEVGAVATIENVFNSYYVVALAEDDSTKNAAEKFEVTCEGDCIKVGKDVGKESFSINIDVTALGMNGTAVTKTINVTVGKPIAGKMKNQDIAVSADDSIDFRWKVADQGLTKAQLEYLADCKWTYSLKNSHFAVSSDAVKFYGEDDKEVSSPVEAVYFGFTATADSKFIAGHKNEIDLNVTNPDGIVVYADLAYVTVFTKVAKTWAFLEDDYSVWDIELFNQGVFALQYENWLFAGSTDVVDTYLVTGAFFDKDMKETSEEEKIAYAGALIDAGVSGEYPVYVAAPYESEEEDAGSIAYFSSSVVKVDTLAAPDFKVVDTAGTMAFYWTKEQAAELFEKCLDSEHWYFDVKCPEDAIAEGLGGTLLLFDENFKETKDRKDAEYVGFKVSADLLVSGEYAFVVYAQTKLAVDKAFGGKFTVAVDEVVIIK